MKTIVTVFTDRTDFEVEQRRWFHSEQDAIDWCAAEGVTIEPPVGPRQRVGFLRAFNPR